jgi:hypothetical protein
MENGEMDPVGENPDGVVGKYGRKSIVGVLGNGALAVVAPGRTATITVAVFCP